MATNTFAFDNGRGINVIVNQDRGATLPAEMIEQSCLTADRRGVHVIEVELDMRPWLAERVCLAEALRRRGVSAVQVQVLDEPFGLAPDLKGGPVRQNGGAE